jgi:hypothetical protein
VAQNPAYAEKLRAREAKKAEGKAARAQAKKTAKSDKSEQVGYLANCSNPLKHCVFKGQFTELAPSVFERLLKLVITVAPQKVRPQSQWYKSCRQQSFAAGLCTLANTPCACHTAILST